MDTIFGFVSVSLMRWIAVGIFLFLIILIAIWEVIFKPVGRIGQFFKQNGRFIFSLSDLFLGVFLAVLTYKETGYYTFAILIGTALLYPLWWPTLMSLIKDGSSTLLGVILLIFFDIIVLFEILLTNLKEENFSLLLYIYSISLTVTLLGWMAMRVEIKNK